MWEAIFKIRLSIYIFVFTAIGYLCSSSVVLSAYLEKRFSSLDYFRFTAFIFGFSFILFCVNMFGLGLTFIREGIATIQKDEQKEKDSFIIMLLFLSLLLGTFFNGYLLLPLLSNQDVILNRQKLVTTLYNVYLGVIVVGLANVILYLSERRIQSFFKSVIERYRNWRRHRD